MSSERSSHILRRLPGIALPMDRDSFAEDLEWITNIVSQMEQEPNEKIISLFFDKVCCGEGGAGEEDHGDAYDEKARRNAVMVADPPDGYGERDAMA
jgi:hypothetical protein